MQAKKIVAAPSEIEARLAAFDVTKEELLRIVHAAVAAKADFVPNDPANAAGQLSYIFGTRALRDVFCSKGWQVNRTGNIESVYHPSKNIKIVFQNADRACDLLREPKAISGKGPAAMKAVESGQGWLFPSIREEEEKAAAAQAHEGTASVWYFCVSVIGEDVSAELSWPQAIDDKQFNGFNERIFVLKSGEWADVTVPNTEPDVQDFEINVVKKS